MSVRISNDRIVKKSIFGETKPKKKIGKTKIKGAKLWRVLSELGGCQGMEEEVEGRSAWPIRRQFVMAHHFEGGAGW